MQRVLIYRNRGLLSVAKKIQAEPHATSMYCQKISCDIFSKSFLLITLFATLLLLPNMAYSENRVASSLLQSLSWRAIGPAVMGGRISAVAGVPGDSRIIYVGHSSAGLYKSTNGGTTFESIFNDGNTVSVGAIALAPENSEIIYVGTGEGTPRNSISIGDGLYKSIDGGKTWKHIGLTDAERFSRIAVNPHNSNIVFAAAMGHAWGPNEERGLFRSTDAGETWEKVLYVNDTTGASDVQIDPANPNIVYAGMYDYLRQPWHFRSGGPGSGLYRSSDGGETWIKLTDPALRNGLPGRQLLGRIGIGISHNNPNVVYAMIESQEEGELWRSDDRGASWKMICDDYNINIRPFYSCVVIVDPQDENRVYALGKSLFLSTDGGRTFATVRVTGGDLHDLWINPLDPSYMINGLDHGVNISRDRGRTWQYVDSQPFGQAYRVSVDMADPYNVLGGFQDNEIWRGPNEKWNRAGIKDGDWYHLINWGDGMYAVADPRDPNIIYTSSHFGNVDRIDMRNGERRMIAPYPVGQYGAGAENHPYRFSWYSPLYMSPNNPDTVYFGSNVLFRTRDGGQTWDIISPDLTTNDREKMKPSGGPITSDNLQAEFYCTIQSISESTMKQDVIWVGTDDGNLQLTQDSGRTWTNVIGNIKGLPPNSWVSSIQTSNRVLERAYVTFDRHQLNDFASYVYVTEDLGKTWKRISDGLRGYVHVIKEDLRQPNVLYVGTELGVFVSFDRGTTWTDLRLGLPPLPVLDLAIHPRDNDLVIATHARSFFVLDDLAPLQGLADGKLDEVKLFIPGIATRYVPLADTKGGGPNDFSGTNPPYGAMISYFLPEMLFKNVKGGEKVFLEIYDAGDLLIRTLNGTSRPGVNRISWDLREAPAKGFTQSPSGESSYLWYPVQLSGAQALPGTYKLRLKVADKIGEQQLAVRYNPRLPVDQSELIAQQTAVRRLIAMQEKTHKALWQIKDIAEQLGLLQNRLDNKELQDQAKEIAKDLLSMEDIFRVEMRYRKPAGLRENIAGLRQMIDSHASGPTKAQSEYMEKFDQQLSNQLKRLNEILGGPLAALNASLKSTGIPHIIYDRLQSP